MALHFHGNQYEQAYRPRILRNWEVPKTYDDKPRLRTGRTRIISNDRGHLLPGVPKSKSSPWGNYIGTWRLPKKIDKNTAKKLNGTFKEKNTCKENREKLEKIEEESQLLPTVEKSDLRKVKGVEEKVAKRQDDQQKNKENTFPYLPGDLTDEKHRHHGSNALEQNRFNTEKPEAPAYPRYREDFTQPLAEIETKTITKNEVDNFSQQQRAMAEKNYSPKSMKENGRKKLPSPIISAIKNFQLAKKLHRENLEHDPLADTITNLKYRKLQMQKAGQEPGLALKDENFATGIGWKGYPGYGPTRCTKLKVYRPKTCGHPEKHEVKNDGRPSSVTSFDRKWRFIRTSKVTPIELAICWDLTPENPSDEPKRTPHIDGSNGSLAPAVFSLVHTPKEEDNSRISSPDYGPLFDKAPPPNVDDKEFVLDRPKTCVRRPSRDSAKSDDSKKRAKSALNLNNNNLEMVEEEREGCVDCDQHRQIHQSTPNLSEHGDERKGKSARMCMACKMKDVSIKDRRLRDNEYKLAFKAGVPPHKDKRQDYPEHWRLATVYQHSYKPIHTRKRPLLATVFN